MIYKNNSPELGNVIDNDRFREDECEQLYCEYCGEDFSLFKTQDGGIVCRKCLAQWCEDNDIIREVWQ